MHSYAFDRTEAEQERDFENLVTVQELIDAVTKLQSTPDSSKLEQIAEVTGNVLLLKKILEPGPWIELARFFLVQHTKR
jgi:hypothetical protein